MLAYPGMEDAITLFMPEEQNPYSTIIMDYITSCELQESPDAKVYYEAIVMAVNEGIDILIHIRVCVCVCVGGGGLWLGLGLLVHGSLVQVLPLADEYCLCYLFSLLPTTPTSPSGCEWVPGISWGANHGSFSLISSGLCRTLCAHTTCCEKVAGPPVSSAYSRSLLVVSALLSALALI